MSTYYWECPQCGQESSAEVDLGEHLVDGLDECEHCSYHPSNVEIERNYSKALEDAVGSRIDSAHEAAKDRELFP